MPYRPTGDHPRPELHDRPWVFTGGALLAAIAGYVNVVVLGFFHVPVSHMTGAASRLGVDVAARDMADVRLVFSILGGFLIGAVASGIIIGGRKLVPGRRYGVALLVEGALLGVATLLLLRNNPFGVTLAAVACGVQNGMASSYYGLVIRTTHVTGIVTDIGVMLGHWIRHRRLRTWKLMLLCGILGGFLLGGVLGAVASSRMGVGALSLAALCCASGGALYYWWRRSHTSPAQSLDRFSPNRDSL